MYYLQQLYKKSYDFCKDNCIYHMTFCYFVGGDGKSILNYFLSNIAAEYLGVDRHPVIMHRRRRCIFCL